MVTSFNHFPQITKALDEALELVVEKTAFDGQANIQGFIRANGQIDTGFMFNGVYVRTFTKSTYTGGEKALPEVERPPDRHTAFIGSAANYSAWQNYGTRFQPARPFFEPGIEQTRPGFEAALGKIEAAIKAKVRDG